MRRRKIVRQAMFALAVLLACGSAGCEDDGPTCAGPEPCLCDGFTVDEIPLVAPWPVPMVDS